MQLRLVMPEDREQLRALGLEAQLEIEPDLGFDDTAFNRAFDRSLAGDPTCFVVEHEGQLIGMATARIDGFYFATGISTMLSLIYVTPGWRGSRAPALLVIAFLRWSDELGSKRKLMGVNNSPDPERTARFFERFGARRVGFFLEG